MSSQMRFNELWSVWTTIRSTLTYQARNDVEALLPSAGFELVQVKDPGEPWYCGSLEPTPHLSNAEHSALLKATSLVLEQWLRGVPEALFAAIEAAGRGKVQIALRLERKRGTNHSPRVEELCDRAIRRATLPRKVRHLLEAQAETTND